MKKTIFALIILAIITASAYANIVSEVQKTKAPLSESFSLPSSKSEKWYIVDVFSRIFNGAGEIQNSYVEGLWSIDGRYSNNIPKWNGNSFIEWSARYSGDDMHINGSINIRWDIYKNGVLFEPKTPLPTPPNCNGGNRVLWWDGSRWSCNNL